jgi:hypothetical protein
MEGNENQKVNPVNIVVHNEDTGKPIHLRGQSSDLVQTFIDALYRELRTPRKDGDRLRCGKGVNVFNFAKLIIGDFQREQCAAHSWTFAGETGGALCYRSQ